MLKTYRIGRLFGFPIEVNLTFLLMLGVIFVSFGGLAGVFTVLLAFGSVLAHELGHALVARRLGVPIIGIELHFFGGAAKMARLPRSARDEILIAIAGPAVSLALAGIGLALGGLTGIELIGYLGWINLLLGGFNLIPALPMDGGRVMRAALSTRMGFARATDTSVKVSRVFSVLFVVAGALTSQFMLAVLGLVVWWMASSEARAAAMVGGYRAWDDDTEILRAGDTSSPGPARSPLDGGLWAHGGAGFTSAPGAQGEAQQARFVLTRGPDGQLRLQLVRLPTGPGTSG